MNTFGLTRTYAGILIVENCRCAQYDHIEENFHLAVQKYSYLVRPGEHMMHSDPEIEHECVYY